jgi:hypothetical protein
MPFELPSRARPTLLVERDSVELVYTPRLASSALSDHGVEAWTPAGDIMRGFLVTLSDALTVRHARSRASVRLARHASGLSRELEYAQDPRGG